MKSIIDDIIEGNAITKQTGNALTQDVIKLNSTRCCYNSSNRFMSKNYMTKLTLKLTETVEIQQHLL